MPIEPCSRPLDIIGQALHVSKMRQLRTKYSFSWNSWQRMDDYVASPGVRWPLFYCIMPLDLFQLACISLLPSVQGKYAKAGPLIERALAIDEKMYGKTHPQVAVDLNNLAALLETQVRPTGRM